jgi:hypothetical protein
LANAGWFVIATPRLIRGRYDQTIVPVENGAVSDQ